MSSLPQIVLAPMEGVIDVVVRHLLSGVSGGQNQVHGLDRLVTEFVRVTERLLPDHVFYRYSPELLNRGRTPHGLPVYVQLLGGRADPLAENAARLVELGAPGVDLNFGCPAKTVNRHDGGATLLKNPDRLFEIISKVKAAVGGRIPVTAKVRLGFSDKSLVREIAQAVNAAQADSLIIHARTKVEGYAPPAHWEFIRVMREHLALPVFANGDIWSPEDYFRCVEISGCTDVALGRGLLSRPSLALEIKARLQGEVYPRWNWTEIYESYLTSFVELTLIYRGERYTLPRLKQMLRFLYREYPEALDLFERVKVLRTVDELKGVLHGSFNGFFESPYQNLHLELLSLLPGREVAAREERLQV